MLPVVNKQQEMMAEWPLHESQEREIMNALSQVNSIPWQEEETEMTESLFTDRTLFQPMDAPRRQSMSSLRCSICQRRFHSLGNLSTHKQLYHEQLYPLTNHPSVHELDV